MGWGFHGRSSACLGIQLLRRVGRRGIHHQLRNHLSKVVDITMEFVDGELLLLQTPRDVEDLPRQALTDGFLGTSLFLRCFEQLRFLRRPVQHFLGSCPHRHVGEVGFFSESSGGALELKNPKDGSVTPWGFYCQIDEIGNPRRRKFFLGYQPSLWIPIVRDPA